MQDLVEVSSLLPCPGREFEITYDIITAGNDIDSNADEVGDDTFSKLKDEVLVLRRDPDGSTELTLLKGTIILIGNRDWVSMLI